MPQHTPGPWMVHPYINQQGPHNKAKDVGPNGLALAVALGRFEAAWSEEDEANARLIAAAPDLLAALKDVMEGDHYEECPTPYFEEKGVSGECSAKCARMRAAIAKAEGGKDR